MRGRLLLSILGVAVTCCAVGCVTQSNDALLARLLADIDATETLPVEPPAHGNGNVPESPDTGLPALESARTRGPGGGSQVLASELTIQPDCIIQIRVDEDPALNGSYPVNQIGAVDLGYIGPVILYNKTEQQAEDKIRDVLTSRHFRKATVKLKILRASYDKIQVAGEVVQPSLIRIGAGDTISLNDALLRAGGLRPTARDAKIKIVRDGLLSALSLALPGEEYPLMAEDGMPSIPDIHLDNNDVAYVLSGGDTTHMTLGEKHVLVLGEVKRRGVYRFGSSEPCSMMHLIFKMGGLPAYADDRAVRIIRRDEEGVEQETAVNVREILKRGDPEDDVPLRDGDRILVPSRVIRLF